jgi:hypothetical protein
MGAGAGCLEAACMRLLISICRAATPPSSPGSAQGWSGSWMRPMGRSGEVVGEAGMAPATGEAGQERKASPGWGKPIGGEMEALEQLEGEAEGWAEVAGLCGAE